jgi:hypothetical protein
MRSNLSSFFAIMLLAVCASSLSAADRILVNGQGSNNLVAFDIDTGVATVIGNYPSGWNPRNLAVDGLGNIYSSLNQGTQNVVKMVPQLDGFLGPVSFTPNLGGAGPGEIQFYRGNLFVAGDTGRRIYEHDGITGTLIQTFSSSTSFNIRAMEISAAGILYYSEIFQDRVRSFDLNTTPPTGSTLINSNANLFESHAMAIGANGNLFVTNRENTLLQEFNAVTGAFVGTFVDIDTFNPSYSSIRDIHFDASRNNFFLTAGSNVLRLDMNGNLLNTYSSPLLTGTATGVIVAPIPEPSTLILGGVSLGIIALCRWRKKHD